SVETLRRNVEKMDRKIGDARRKKDVLKAQSQIADTQQKIIAATSAAPGSGAFEEYARIEEKIDEKTQRAQVEAELAAVSTTHIDDKLEEVSFGHEVDKELEALK